MGSVILEFFALGFLLYQDLEFYLTLSLQVSYFS